MKKNTKKKGFTLIELIVVIAILGLLAAILIPKFGGFTDKAKSAQATVDAKQIATALDGLIAEDATVVYTEAQVMAIADKDGEIQDNANYVLTLPVTADTRTFTLVETIGGTTFTAARAADGKITVTWP